MLLIDKNKNKRHISTEAIEVFDVSGAGDTVIASFTAMMAMGKSTVECARFANKAAGIVVAKHGAATATLKEIFEEKDKNA